MASTHVTRSVSSTGNINTATMSCWFKRANVGAEHFLFYSLENSNNNCRIRISTDDKLEVEGLQGGSSSYTIRTQRKFRDTSSFYHVVVAYDSTDGTASDRIKIYVNGIRETELENINNPSSSVNMSFNENGSTVYVGSQYNGNYFDGCIAHYHWVDGQAYLPSVFGQTNATSGHWTPITSPSVTYGTNGFFLKFENSSDMDLDSSSNSHTFTTSGTLTQNIDTPTNVYCVCNALVLDSTNNRYTNGGLRYDNAGSYNSHAQGTFGMQSGKWYWEIKMNGSHGQYGVCESTAEQAQDPQVNDPYYFLYSGGSGAVVYNNATGNNSTTQSGWTPFSSGEIIGVAYDADNGKLYFHNNGVYYNSGDPANGTGAVIDNIVIRQNGVIMPFIGQGTGNARTHDCNWGQGYFGTTQVSTSNADANGHGLFEYAVPTGFYALCTKNIKEFG
jgi:hypothetical protein